MENNPVGERNRSVERKPADAVGPDDRDRDQEEDGQPRERQAEQDRRGEVEAQTPAARLRLRNAQDALTSSHLRA